MQLGKQVELCCQQQQQQQQQQDDGLQKVMKIVTTLDIHVSFFMNFLTLIG
jgi:hypothetical protein